MKMAMIANTSARPKLIEPKSGPSTAPELFNAEKHCHLSGDFTVGHEAITEGNVEKRDRQSREEGSKETVSAQRLCGGVGGEHQPNAV